MQSVKVSYQKVETIKTNKAIDGLIIGFMTQHDAGTTLTPSTHFIDPTKVLLTLRNDETDQVMFSMSVAEMYAINKAGEVDLPKVLDGLSHHELGTGKALMPLSFPLPVYHGNYSLKIETKENSFRPNTKVNSYVSVGFNLSTEPMTAETVYQDLSIDKAIDNWSVNGVASIIMMDFSKIWNGNESSIDNVADSINIQAAEDQDTYDKVGLKTRHSLSCEEPTTFKYPQMIVHDGHILTNCAVEFNGTPTGKMKMYFTRVIKSPLVEESALVQDKNAENTAKRIG